MGRGGAGEICGQELPSGSLCLLWLRLGHRPVARLRGDLRRPLLRWRRGRPAVDYHFELEHPEDTVRVYEWGGVARVVADLRPSGSGRWLDFGCGNGGLVRYLRERNGIDAIGFEEGSIAARARDLGIPVLDRQELAREEGSFDVVTAIEVLEHTADPVAELRQIRRLLKTGGLFFATTGNAEPYADRLSEWKYVVPEIHISFFEPRTLELALREADFQPERRALGRGFDDVLKFKLLKNLKRRRRSRLTDLIPARLLAPPLERITRAGPIRSAWRSDPG